MASLPMDLAGLRNSDPDVALILDSYAEIERVYQDALEAMGASGRQAPEVKNTAEVTISFREPPSSSAYPAR